MKKALEKAIEEWEYDNESAPPNCILRSDNKWVLPSTPDNKKCNCDCHTQISRADGSFYTECTRCENNHPIIPQSTEEECNHEKGACPKLFAVNEDPFIEKTLAEFDEIWRMWSNDTSLLNYEKIKDFLSSVLNAQREEIRKEVNKLKWIKEKISYNVGNPKNRRDRKISEQKIFQYNRAINKVLAFLSPNNKENE